MRQPCLRRRQTSHGRCLLDLYGRDDAPELAGGLMTLLITERTGGAVSAGDDEEECKGKGLADESSVRCNSPGGRATAFGSTAFGQLVSGT